MAFVVNSYIPLPSPDNHPNVSNQVWEINDSGTVSGFTLAATGTVAYTLSPGGAFSFPSYPGGSPVGAFAAGGTTDNGVIFGNAKEPDTVPFGWVDNNGIFTALPSGQ